MSESFPDFEEEQETKKINPKTPRNSLKWIGIFTSEKLLCKILLSSLFFVQLVSNGKIGNYKKRQRFFCPYWREKFIIREQILFKQPVYKFFSTADIP